TTSVNVTGNMVHLQLKNRTRGYTFDKRVYVNSLDLSSAEWIAEAPSSCSRFTCNPLPLANFGSVSISRIAAIGASPAIGATHPGTITDPAWTAVPIQLVPRAKTGFFPGPDRGFVTFDPTAGTP